MQIDYHLEWFSKLYNLCRSDFSWPELKKHKVLGFCKVTCEYAAVKLRFNDLSCIKKNLERTFQLKTLQLHKLSDYPFQLHTCKNDVVYVYGLQWLQIKRYINNNILIVLDKKIWIQMRKFLFEQIIWIFFLIYVNKIIVFKKDYPFLN